MASRKVYLVTACVIVLLEQFCTLWIVIHYNVTENLW